MASYSLMGSLASALWSFRKLNGYARCCSSHHPRIPKARIPKLTSVFTFLCLELKKQKLRLGKEDLR